MKCVLKDDGYQWDDNRIMLTTLTKSCKLINDRVRTRLPITLKLLELMLFETQRLFSNQWYLENLYKTMLILGYYGLLRIGEMTSSPHCIKAKNVHVGKNKNKILLVLYSSKTHGEGDRPQKIKIHSRKNQQQTDRFFCPFAIARHYFKLRGDYVSDEEQFFIYKDRTSVDHQQFRAVFNQLLTNLNLDNSLYSVQSLRAGRATEMVKHLKFSIQEVKFAGRWKSNAVFKYIKT